MPEARRRFVGMSSSVSLGWLSIQCSTMGLVLEPVSYAKLGSLLFFVSCPPYLYSLGNLPWPISILRRFSSSILAHK